MSTSQFSDGGLPVFTPPRRERWKRWVVVFGLPVLLVLLLFLMLWNTFFRYVPPGHMLIIIAKNGDPLPAGQVLAEPGQRGIQRAVLGEGWHYVTPIIYTTEVKPNTVIPPGQVGIVTALGGVPPRDGRVLAEEDDEQGIRRQVLLPGSYRLNPYGYTVETVPATEITPGYVGVMQRLLGKDGADRFASRPDEKGILREVLQPGLYYLNTKEFKVTKCEVGIYQTTYHYDDKVPERNTAITFPAKDGNTIQMDCTIEWEVKPVDWPALVAEYGNLTGVERNVVDQHARQISRDRGFNFGAQDFLEGEKRETFQADFTQQLEQACRDNNVVVRSAFIRNIIIPEAFLKQKRDRQLAMERKLTSEAKQETAVSNAAVAEAKSKIQQSEANVKAETARLVAGVERQTQNITLLTDAQIENLKAEYGAKIALLDAQRNQVKGEAKAEAEKLKETARSSLFRLKREVFQNDGDAFLRYSMAQQLNPKMVLRVFHSGPGTLWTNLNNKNMNLLLPTPGAGAGTGTPAPPERKE